MDETKLFQQPSSIYEIKTRRGPKENEIGFCPARGGIITSMKPRGQEVLYLDQTTFDDPKQKVKGGIPILFPNAGPLPDGGPYQLAQHGFARTSDRWTAEDTSEGELTETLISDDETKKQFPFDCSLAIKTKLEGDGSVTVAQETKNLETEKEMPVSMGLHPYFKVPEAEKKNIKFDFPGGEIIESECDKWSTGGTTSIDNPKFKNPEAVLRVTIPGLGTLIMDVSPEYQKIWIWSLPGKDFVCVEPVMRDQGGLVHEPAMVKPGETLTGKINYRLE